MEVDAHMAFQTNSAVNDQDEMPSVPSTAEVNVLTDSLDAVSSNGAVITPAGTTKLIDIDTMLSVSPSSPPVEPVVESDAQRLS